MKKEDFHKGQTVWIYLVNDAARGKKTTEERIQEWEVVSVGKKYLTARPKGRDKWSDIKFEIENNFQQASTYAANYKLYLSKEDILRDIWRKETREYISTSANNWYGSILARMTDKDLQAVADIFGKYDKEDTIQ